VGNGRAGAGATNMEGKRRTGGEIFYASFSIKLIYITTRGKPRCTRLKVTGN
jgi:hypothetical protein